MLRALIIDDESRARNILRILIDRHLPKIKEVYSAAGAREALEIIGEKKPHILFLDIEMPFMDGFDLLAEVEERNFEIIFTTAHNQYAIKAIRFSALDYLLKPIEPEELKAAFGRYLEKRHILSDNKKLYHHFINHFSDPHNDNPRLAIATQEGAAIFHVNEIVRCEASSNYTLFYLHNGDRFLASKPLKEYDNILSEYNFCRTHKSHLVNRAFVKNYAHQGFLILEDDSQVEVSRRRKKNVKDWLGL